MFAGGQGAVDNQGPQHDNDLREGLASGIFAEEPTDDWGSLRADLDRALSEAQQAAVPQPDQPDSPQSSEKADREKCHIPQTDGASDRFPWQGESWSLSPHILGAEADRELRNISADTCVTANSHSAGGLAQQAECSASGSSSQSHTLHSSESRPARRSAVITFTPKAEAPASQQVQEAEDSKITRRKYRRASQSSRGHKRAQNPTCRRLPQIPQVDGSGDARPRRNGSSWNRGKGRLLRQPSPLEADDSQGLEQSQGTGRSQREASERVGSQRGSSQRYAALSVQQSPQKSGLQNQARSIGKFCEQQACLSWYQARVSYSGL